MTDIETPVRRSISTYRADSQLFDQALGARVKALRIVAGMTLRNLASHLDFSFQQMHKYEMGQARLSVYTLHKISDTLNVPMMTFFDDMPNISGGIREIRDVLETALAIQKIKIPDARQRLMTLIKELNSSVIEPDW